MTMTDILMEQGECTGIVVRDRKGDSFCIYAKDTILATGGIGGKYQHSTNFPHLPGDSVEIAERHGIRLENLDYVQIHPTTLYSEKAGRRFLISESVRGEGAVLYDKHGKRFTDELKPRDVVTRAIREQMKKDAVSYTHLRAHETQDNLVCRLLLEKNFFNDTATTEIYTMAVVGSVRCV